MKDCDNRNKMCFKSRVRNKNSYLFRRNKVLPKKPRLSSLTLYFLLTFKAAFILKKLQLVKQILEKCTYH